jgi:hypothetical protein
MKPIDIFLNQWKGINDIKSKDYSIVENLELKDGAIAQVGIFLKEECIGFGNYFNELKLPNENEIRSYFHGKNGFIGCGTNSKFWFYFDDKAIIINDHKYKYPYDELMRDFNELFERITKEYN